MNNRDQHIISSLRRWLQGEITHQEERRLDQDAQNEPFLSEALEGYRQFPESDHSERLDRMRNALPLPQAKRRFLAFTPLRVAAAAIIVLGFGLFWYINNDTSSSLADAKTSEPPSEIELDSEIDDATSAPATSMHQEELPKADDQEEKMEFLSANPGEPSDIQTPAQSMPRTEGNQSAILTEEVPNTPLAFNETRDARSDTEKEESEQVATEAISNRNEARPNHAPPSAPPPPGEKRSVNEFSVAEADKPDSPTTNRLVSGKVLDPAGMPLIGVQVMTPGGKGVAITDLDGQYQIALDSNIKNLDFALTGFTTQRIDLPSDKQYLQVTLNQEEASLDEVVVSGYGRKKQKQVRRNPAVSITSNISTVAQPTGGFKRYARYLQRNLNYPRSAIEKDISGEVKLSFTIMPDGRVTNILVIQGPGGGLHEEAVRLIANGPKWKITGDSQDPVPYTYSLMFTIY